MARRKKRIGRIKDPGSIIDSIKTLVIEGIHLYEKVKPIFRRTKPRAKTGSKKPTKQKGKKKNDSSKISDNGN